MTLYGAIERAGKSRELDRGTWAGEQTIVFAYETNGAGNVRTSLLDFGVIFEGVPFFSYGVELAPGATLVEGDYPFVSAGVAEWVVKENVDDFAEKQLKLLHTGAYVFLNVNSRKAYKLIFRMTFEGVTFKNPQLLR